jgi:hypothetical protein
MSHLHIVLAANAVSCAVFGGLFVVAPSPVAAFLGQPPAPAALIVAIGAVLLLNAVHLGYVATTARPSHWAVTYFSIGDGLWVVATLVLIVSGTWITAPGGIVAALAVALGVGAFGTLQWRLRPTAYAAQ